MENEQNIFQEILSMRWSHPNIIPIYGLYRWQREYEGEKEYVYAFVM